jgi:hypothetical protein
MTMLYCTYFWLVIPPYSLFAVKVPTIHHDRFEKFTVVHLRAVSPHRRYVTTRPPVVAKFSVSFFAFKGEKCPAKDGVRVPKKENISCTYIIHERVHGAYIHSPEPITVFTTMSGKCPSRIRTYICIFMDNKCICATRWTSRPMKMYNHKTPNLKAVWTFNWNTPYQSCSFLFHFWSFPSSKTWKTEIYV